MDQVQLFFVPTPIGHLKDITLRALEVLELVDCIYCEDTRHSQRLLEEYDIHKPLISYHEHNEKARLDEIIDRIVHGEKIAVISDAGMPAISDPGKLLIQRVIEEKIPFTVLPGPSAGIVALVASSFGDGSYLFLGFLPRKGRARQELLERIDELDIPAVIYEAPHRIVKSLEEFAKRWPERRFSFAREISKAYEEFAWFYGRDLSSMEIKEKGEYVVIIDGKVEEASWDKSKVIRLLEELTSNGLYSKEIIQKAHELTGWSKNDLYSLQLSLKEDSI